MIGETCDKPFVIEISFGTNRILAFNTFDNFNLGFELKCKLITTKILQKIL